MTAVVYVNGEFVPPERAVVPILDRGFMFGDGVYEVIPAYGGCLFRLPQHLDRLDRSLAAIRLDNPLSREAWRTVLAELLRRNGGGDRSVYLQVTRGTAPRDHVFPAGVRPTVVAQCTPMAALPAQGVAAITAPDMRWESCNIKAITLLPNVLVRQQAREAGAYEAILHRAGRVTEGAASNVFVVHGDEVATPPKGPHLLAGITRDLVMELLQAAGRPCREREVQVAELAGADEIWLTSSTREVMAATRLDDRPVGEGTAGPRWREVNALYQACKADIDRWCG
ncbi:MAG: D-amino acid aminotransferase [Gammaproteobacteria bacterium]|nr:D-amino acid aminotransferase [Gammaproteobacteria bacterium]